METNQLATHAMIEPMLSVFVLRKIFPRVDDYTLKGIIRELNPEDIEELVGILISMGFEDKTIEKILKQ